MRGEEDGEKSDSRHGPIRKSQARMKMAKLGTKSQAVLWLESRVAEQPFGIRPHPIGRQAQDRVDSATLSYVQDTDMSSIG